jgi:hypothetical protein
MQIRINCKCYTPYGQCKKRKGIIFLKGCVELYNKKICDIKEPYPRPDIIPVPQQPRSLIR